MRTSISDGRISNERSVVITGIGVISACGLTVKTFWDSVLKGNSGGKAITRFDTSNLPSKIAAEITGFDCDNYVSPRKSKRYDLGMKFAAAASMEALADAKMNISKIDPDRIGLVHANSLEGMESAFRAWPVFADHGYKKIGPSFLLNNYFGASSGELALLHGIKGHAITYSSGSASGSDVITLAADMIKNDDVDIVLVGASEAPLLIQIMAGFCNARVVSKNNSNPKAAMRAFDQGHDGFLIGEGSAFLVLEEKSYAKERGVRIYAEFSGGGRSCEAYHPVNIHPEGVGLKSAVNKALKKARLKSYDVDYINAHGTATDFNDKIEAQALQDLFGDHSKKMAVSSCKAVTGHLLAASGALETAICALTIYNQKIPPIINLSHQLEGIHLNLIKNHALPYPVNVAMNINAGFGGKNSCIILNKCI